jgi:NitT/TauT family transport system permease protein
LLGLESTDRHLEELFELYGARPVHYWWKLKIPAALPEIFNGLRIGIGLAIIGTIVGEFVAGGGLGAIIDTARTQQRVDKVFAAIILSSLMGIVAVFILESFRRKFLAHWHASLLKGNPND